MKWWKLSKPLYGLTPACKEWYIALREFTDADLRSRVNLLDRSVSSGQEKIPNTISEKVRGAMRRQ